MSTASSSSIPQFPPPEPEFNAQIKSFLEKQGILPDTNDAPSFYTQFWANPQAVQTKTWTLEFELPALRWTSNKLLIFDEYLDIAQEVAAKWTQLRQDPTFVHQGLLIAGNSGIGM